MKNKKMIAIVAMLVVGFAAVSTNLLINGSVGVSVNEKAFNVIFTEALINGEGSSATIDEETKQTITFSSSKLVNVNEEAILDYKVKNNSTQYDADVTINCTSDTSEYISVVNEFDGNQITEDFKTTLNAQEEKSGVVKAKLVKSYVEDTDASIKVTCTLVATPTERDEVAEEQTTSKWVLTLDNDADGKISFGDLITLGTDDFYVYDTTGESVKVLRKNLLDCGNVEFSTASIMGDTRGSYTGSQSEAKVLEYANTLDSEAGIISARLITLEELESIGCSSEKQSCKAGYVRSGSNLVEDASFVGGPAWLHSVNYFTMSAKDNNNVYRVLNTGILDSADVRMMLQLGIRPVLEISKSAL